MRGDDIWCRTPARISYGYLLLIGKVRCLGHLGGETDARPRVSPTPFTLCGVTGQFIVRFIG